jgi:hypothetical protein
MKAIEQGLAGLTPTREELLKTATEKINSSREMIDVLMREGCIAPVPEE